MFQASFQALWGPYYISEAARQFGIGRSSATRYDQGEREMPEEVMGQLGKFWPSVRR
jgi:hypothetical protein